jgi:hypothetical protein
MSCNVTVETITYDPKRDAFVLIVVEQGPWPPDAINTNLSRIQRRLLDCVDAAVDGGVALKLPHSAGKLVVIRLNCYETPHEEVEQFFFRLVEYVHSSLEIQDAIRQKRHIAALEFEFNWRKLFNEA